MLQLICVTLIASIHADSMGVMRGRTCLLSLSSTVAGGWVTAYANIVTAVIGSGVLSLAWSMSWLGGALRRHVCM